MDFVHLHVNSAYSFLWGTFLPEDLVKRAWDLRYKYVCLTDKENLLGITKFYTLALNFGLIPIIGCEIEIDGAGNLIFLVKNNQGYIHLNKILTQKRLKKQFHLKDLANLKDGLICITGGRFSKLRQLLDKDQIDNSILHIEILQQIFSKESLFIAIQNHGLKNDLKIIDTIFSLSEKLHIDTVVTFEVAYLYPDDFELHKVFCDISKKYHHINIKSLPNNNFFFKEIYSVENIFCNHKKSIFNSIKIAEICSKFNLPINRPRPPKIFLSSEYSFKKLSNMVLKELASRKNPLSIEYIKRISKELSIIKTKELSDFFLIVKDIYDFAKQNNIRTTVRGSAAGSLIIHLILGGVDPVSHNLLFERFLNEGRSDFPDVDLDFDSEKRDMVFDYIFKKYPDRCSFVSTVLTFRSRGAIRMIGRALDYSYEEIKALSECIPPTFRCKSIETALKRFPELKDHPILKEEKLLDLSIRASSLPFRRSVHLGGVIICNEDILNISPIFISNKKYPVIDMDKDDIDIWKLFKLDILGLRMHTAIRKTIETLHKLGNHIDIDEIPLNDKKTYDIMCKGDTIGIFQVESPGQRELIRRLRPTKFSDIISEISLFRPGPVKGNMVADYIKRRQKREKITYPAKELIPILKDTYGVIIFQEQVLEIAHRFANMSYAEADSFRRAMTKDRSKKEMEKLKKRFIKGAIAKGYSREVAEEVFDMVSCFAAYGFCKAHAASFAYITYQSAYLKAHYPREFYIGLLNAGHVGSYPKYVILNEAKRKNIPIYPPNVNCSLLEFIPYKDGILMPLTTINFIGEKTAIKIIKEREKNGPFLHWKDLYKRCKLSKKVIDMLIYAGAISDNNFDILPN